MTNQVMLAIDTLRAAAHSREPAAFQQVPHNIEAEQALLGAILANMGALEGVAHFLKPQHFFDPLHAQIFERATELIQAGGEVTSETLKPFFDQYEPIAPGLTVPQYLVRLASCSSKTSNAIEHGKTVYDLALRRTLIAFGEELVRKAFDHPSDRSTDAQIREAQSWLNGLAEEYRTEAVTPFSGELAATTNDQAQNVELSLIVPAYNESAIIHRNVCELERWMNQNMPGLEYEILVIDDGSSDGMGEGLDEMAKTHPRLRVSHHKDNKGRGRAIRTGFENSRGRYVICLDADLSYAPGHIPTLFEPLRAGKADITLASAYHPEGSVENVPWSRAVLSKWGNKVLSSGLRGKYHTVTCVVRGYTREVLDLLEFVNNGKDLHLEVIQKAEMFGVRVVEVPGHLKWRDRDRGKKRKSRLIDYIPFLSMSGTIASHLVYNYVLRPGSFLNIPVAGLILTAAAGALLLLGEWVARIATSTESFGLGLIYRTLRETLLQGGLTLAITLAALVISLIFIAFYFASHQNKRNFEEMYVLMTRMNARIKGLERKTGERCAASAD